MLQRWRQAKGLEDLAAQQSAYNEIQNTLDTIDAVPVALPQNSRATPQ